MDEDPSETETRQSSARVAEFDPATESAAETVIQTVATQLDTTRDELDSLEDIVDRAALDRIVRSVAMRSGSTHAEVTLRYHGYTVTVNAYGTVEVAPHADG